MTKRHAVVAGIAGLALLVSGCGGGGSSDGADGATSTTTTAATSTTSASTTTEAPTDPRAQLTQRLGTELDDPALAETIVADLDDELIAKLQTLAEGDIATSPALAYKPSTVPDSDVDSLWVFSYGYQMAPGSPVTGVGLGEEVPPMDQLVPGPTNEELAQQAADFVAKHPVPIIAQWEVAQVLEEMNVPNVISVEPDMAPDGSTTYLSTTGVAEKGLRLAEQAGVDPGHAGVLCFADHAVRCVMTARQAGLEADVPEGVDLPTDYDPESGQTWTRQRETWIPVDLLGRTVLAS